MKTKTKNDYQGNKVVLNGKKLYHYNNNGKLRKIVEYLSKQEALQEFNTLTLSYRGCGCGNTRRKRECATVFYSQLILKL